MSEDRFELEGEEFTAHRPDYNQKLIELLKSNISPKALKEGLSDYHDNDIADMLESISPEDRNRLYRILDAQELAGVLEYTDDAAPYLDELSLRKRIDVLSVMDTSVSAEYLKSLDKGSRHTITELLPREVMDDVSLLLSFDEDEIGSIMSTNYIVIHSELSVKEAMHALVDQAAENDNISTIYAVDENETFYGAIDLKDLIIARENTELTSLIATSYPYFYAHEQIEDCLERIKRYSEDSIPVLNDHNRILGVITAQDLVQIVDDELGEDYAMLAGLSAEEDLNEPVFKSVRKRLPWLLILLGLGLVVSGVVGIFETVVAQLTLIMCFQSLILDMSGNVGTQSLAVTIRVLMDEQLTARQKLVFVIKEARVGLTNGLLMGTISCLMVGFYIFLFKDQPMSQAFAISGCIGAAMLLAMLLSSVVGTTIPLFFKKIHVDPAVASGPLITTINDLVAVVAYYGLSWIFLINFLHIT